MSIAPLSLHDLAELLPRLQATVELLTGQHQAQSHRGPGRPPSTSTASAPAKKNGRGPGRRAGGEAVREKLLAQLKGSKGLSLSELTAKTKITPSIIGYNLRELRTAKKARLVGSRRQAKWFAL